LDESSSCSRGTSAAASWSSAFWPTTGPHTGPSYGATPCHALGITPKHTRPYRPQTNGKIERFHRTLTGWALDVYYPSETARRAALPAWLHDYNHHRPHTAIGRATPISPITNLAGQHI